MNGRKALICGVSGQDGAYLARLLLEKGYEVYGSSRDAAASSFANLERLGVRERVRVVSIAPADFRSVLQQVSRIRPDEIYSLAGQSSVGLSFEQPVETLESIALGTMNLLEAIRFLGQPIRFYNAASGECFGDSGDAPCDEDTPFRPRSPYAVAKAAAYWAVANYRDAYSLFACSGLLFNHESPLRHPRFVTQKIVHAVSRIAAGGKEKLALGDLSVSRDWGWAPEYVEAMWRMLQGGRPEDFVIATGASHTLEAFVAEAFAARGLDWRAWTVSDPALLRPSDIRKGWGNPARAKERLGWSAKHGMREVVRMMLDAADGQRGRPA